MSSAVCEKCGKWKNSVVSVCLGCLSLSELIERNPDISEKIEERKTGFELGLFAPYKAEEVYVGDDPYTEIRYGNLKEVTQSFAIEPTTKEVFLKKCFGDWWENSSPLKVGGTRYRPLLLEAWLGCAERFNFNSDSCFHVSDRKRLEEAVKIIDNLEAAHDIAADQRNAYQMDNDELRTENAALRGRILILEGKR